MTKLTNRELRALDAPLNLADAHTHQAQISAERDEITARLPEIFVKARALTQREADDRGITEFLRLSRQFSVLEAPWYLPTYSSSISFEIVANVLRDRSVSVGLVEPVFDNIPDILRRLGIAASPIRLGPDATYRAAVEEQLQQRQTGAVVLVVPNNPTGHVLEEEELVGIAERCGQTKTLLVLDACFRIFDDRAMYDWYAALDGRCEYILIEDTGKVWPTADLKLSYILASPAWRADLTTVQQDVLLNVSPFVSLLVERYSLFSQRDGLSSVRDLIARNREALQRKLRASTLDWAPTYASRLSVELLSVPSAPSAAALAGHLEAEGVAVLPGGAFYWASPADGDREIRVALARSPDYFDAAVERLIVGSEAYLRDRA